MRLLIEVLPTDFADFKQEVIEERDSVTDGITRKNYFITGPFLQCEVKNRNGRVYPKAILVKEVARYQAEKIDRDQSVGELDHPDTPHINLANVSHKIVSLKEDGNNFIGKAKILNTPRGQIVKGLIDEGIRFGVSSRCLGSLKPSHGVQIVQNDLYMITPADIVSDPSAPDAYVTALMENKEWVWENDKLVEREREIKNIINKMNKDKELLFLTILREILK
jgi:hypothetical protein